MWSADQIWSYSFRLSILLEAPENRQEQSEKEPFEEERSRVVSKGTSLCPFFSARCVSPLHNGTQTHCVPSGIEKMYQF
jgi:hypothetical protein